MNVAVTPAVTVMLTGLVRMLGASCGVQPYNQVVTFVAASRRASPFVSTLRPKEADAVLSRLLFPNSHKI